ncbi:MAG: protein-export chaperone SecB [Chitinophagales bacterium]|nr:protein-export chaperone SecB [Chitinophagales bacterium]
MKISDQIKLKFYGVDFPIVNFNSLKPFQKGDKRKISINISPKIFYPKDKPDSFKIIQEVSLSSENFFELFVLAVGSFEIKSTAKEKDRKNFINLNAPAIMFPYIRAFISNLTSNLGNVTGALTIPPQFFKGDLEIVKEAPDKRNLVSD